MRNRPVSTLPNRNIVKDQVQGAGDSVNVKESTLRDTNGLSITTDNPNHTITPTTTTTTTTMTTMKRSKPKFTITEKVNAYFVDGQVDKVLVSGDVVLCNGSMIGFTSPNTPGRIFINTSLETIVCNEAFITKSSDNGFDVLQSVNTYDNVPLLKYQVNKETIKLPISFCPYWRISPDHVDLLITFTIPKSDLITPSTKIDSFKIVATLISSNQEVLQVGSVESQPVAHWDLDAKSIIWDLEQVVRKSIFEDVSGQLVARIDVSCATCDLLGNSTVSLVLNLSNTSVSGITMGIDGFHGGNEVEIERINVGSGVYMALSRFV